MAAALKSQRVGYKGSLTKTKTMFATYDRSTIDQISWEYLRGKLQTCEKNLKENHMAVMALLTDDAALQAQQDDQDKESDRVHEMELFLHECQRNIKARERAAGGPPPVTGAPNPVITQVLGHKPKLPQLQLPKFSGNLEEWLTFRDRFTQAVHNRSDLSGAEKLQYLLSSLEGAAAKTLETTAITDGNYMNAWAALKNKFEHTREIIVKHIYRILDQPEDVERSAESIHQVLNTTTNALQAAKSLGEDPDTWSTLITAIITRKIDPETRFRFYQSLPDKQFPAWKTMEDFLIKEAMDLETIPVATKKYDEKVKNKQHTKVSNFSNKKSNCSFCCDSHPNFKCPKFIKAKDTEKLEILKQSKVCTNCLNINHTWKNCHSTGTCRECKQRHNSLLHSIFGAKSDRPTATTLATTTVATTLKPTAIVAIKDSRGVNQNYRSLLDSCSDNAFVTNEVITKLGLPKKRLEQSLTITALEGIQVKEIKEYATITLISLQSLQPVTTVDAFIVKTISLPSPQNRLDCSSWTHIPKYALADPHFYLPNRVDILLPTSVFYEVMRPMLIKGGPGMPVVQETEFGFVVAGGQMKMRPNVSQCSMTVSTLEEDMRKFWELEQGDNKQHFSPEEKACIHHFEETTVRLPDGRFQVRLPFKLDRSPLGNSYNQAYRRLQNLEKRFIKNGSLYQDYANAMNDLMQQGHMEEVPFQQIRKQEDQAYYLPHHPVIKESSSTTKLRIVFDASSKSSTGVSLNDQLMLGPVLQQRLHSLLVRWRFWRVAMTADIRQMYLQIKLHPSDSDYQRILWRSSPKEPVKVYRIGKVTFGVASAPFQAVKTLMTLASAHEVDLPLAASVVSSDFYMDDCMSGSNSVAEAVEKQQQLLQLMSKGKFTLRKWASSHPGVTTSLPEELREDVNSYPINSGEALKALGISWYPSSDQFQFFAQPTNEKITKRNVLSDISRIFDPLGLLAPITIRAKMLMQKIWKAQIGWDSILPSDLQLEWKSYLQGLQDLQSISIPRCVNSKDASSQELHLFTDASEKAYGCCVYLRSVNVTHVTLHLITAKSRVAPLKPETLPRLELCAALLGAQLLETVRTSLPITIPQYGWTDSTIALHWIRSDASKWKTFERNRVAKIQEILPGSNWNHVPGKSNPADLPSRGLSANELAQSPMWFSGPTFLRQKRWTIPPIPQVNQALLTSLVVTEGRVATLFIQNPKLDTFLARHSCWTKLRRHTCWLIRFWRFHLKKEIPTQPHLQPDEIQRAEDMILHYLQQCEFHQEYTALKQLTLHQQRRSKVKLSRFLNLDPFVDQSDLIRVGGRLEKSKLPYSGKHPIILPRHHVTKIMVQQLHQQLLHGGTQLCLNLFRRKFWMSRARSYVRAIINKCKTCVVQRALILEQKMASLPEPRVTMARAFSRVGTDYAGPITIRESMGRSPRTHKAYIALFVCLCTKAVHLELVSSLTTEAFIATFRRLVSRRGIPEEIRSDNGSNFLGAKREIQELLQFTSRADVQHSISKSLTANQIRWSFNPPGAPHMGGIWESAVKSAKHHLHRVLREGCYTFEEYSTVLAEVEACLNSRPLCPISPDPGDLEALTPGHFLIGAPLKALPEHDLTMERIHSLSRWQRQQQSVQHFWKRWHEEYLTQLQKRNKWQGARSNITEGSLVVIREENVPPQRWRLGRIVACHGDPSDQQQLVRSVTIKTASGELKRPVVKIVPLPMDDEVDE